MGVTVRTLALALVLLWPRASAAEWQIKPSFGVTFAGATTLLDPERAVGSPNLAVGVGVLSVGEMLGLEADLGYGPGFFQAGDAHLIVRSSTTTLTGNVVVAVPRRLTQYTLRPYLVGGGGLMHAHTEDFFATTLTSNLPAVDFGGGVTGFLTNRLGLSWDVRYFRSVGTSAAPTGISFGPEELSFWRASMAVAIRY